MKFCKACGETKEESGFHKDKKSKDGLAFYCKSCVSVQGKRNHERRMQDPEYAEKHRARLRERAQNRKAWVVREVFGGACYDCGESYPPCVFDFHHEGDNKEGNPSHFIGRNKLSAALPELEKCVMLCANCHRRRHFMKENNDTAN